jgi:2-iminobutanoate/2-iminopropanoate deaminase
MKIIKTNKAPKAIGPYSQGILTNGFLFTAGQIGLCPKSMKMVNGGVLEQSVQVLRNLEAVLLEAGLNKNSVVKTTIFLKNLEDFSDVNNAYAEFFGEHKPARSLLRFLVFP